jgi:hypothetical protein
MTSKKILLEFTDVTEYERNTIVKYRRDPENKDLPNRYNNFHCVVISLFFHEKMIISLKI